MNHAKTALLVLIASVFVLAVAASAHADGISITSPTSLDLGDSATQRGLVVSGVVTLQNNQNSTITNIVGVSNAASSYNVQFIGIPATLAPGAVASITVQVNVSALAPIDRTSIGSISFTANGGTLISSSIPLTIQAKNPLSIRSAESDINGDTTSIKRSGDEIKAKPGDTVQITVNVKNDGPHNVDFTDVSLQVTSNGDSNVDESDSFSNLRQGDSDTLTVQFTIPTDAQDDDTLQFVVQADDENGQSYTQDWNVDLTLDRPSHQVSVNSLQIYPTQNSCVTGSSSNTKTTATVVLQNTGRSNENQITLELSSPDMNNFFKRIVNLQLDRDEKLTKTFDIPTIGLPAGEYLISTTSYYQNNVESDSNAVSYTVVNCGNTGNNNNQNNNNNNPNTQQNTTTPPAGNIVVSNSGTNTPFTNPPYLGQQTHTELVSQDMLYIAILALAGVLLIVAIIFLIVKMMR